MRKIVYLIFCFVFLGCASQSIPVFAASNPFNLTANCIVTVGGSGLGTLARANAQAFATGCAVGLDINQSLSGDFEITAPGGLVGLSGVLTVASHALTIDGPLTAPIDRQVLSFSSGGSLRVKGGDKIYISWLDPAPGNSNLDYAPGIQAGVTAVCQGPGATKNGPHILDFTGPSVNVRWYLAEEILAVGANFCSFDMDQASLIQKTDNTRIWHFQNTTDFSYQVHFNGIWTASWSNTQTASDPNSIVIALDNQVATPGVGFFVNWTIDGINFQNGYRGIALDPNARTGNRLAMWGTVFGPLLDYGLTGSVVHFNSLTDPGGVGSLEKDYFVLIDSINSSRTEPMVNIRAIDDLTIQEMSCDQGTAGCTLFVNAKNIRIGQEHIEGINFSDPSNNFANLWAGVVNVSIDQILTDSLTITTGNAFGLVSANSGTTYHVGDIVSSNTTVSGSGTTAWAVSNNNSTTFGDVSGRAILDAGWNGLKVPLAFGFNTDTNVSFRGQTPITFTATGIDVDTSETNFVWTPASIASWPANISGFAVAVSWQLNQVIPSSGSPSCALKFYNGAGTLAWTGTLNNASGTHGNPFYLNIQPTTALPFIPGDQIRGTVICSAGLTASTNLAGSLIVAPY